MTERPITGNKEQGRQLVDQLRSYAFEMAGGSHSAAFGMVNLAFPLEQDGNIKFRNVNNLTPGLQPTEQLAVRFMQDYIGRFHRNFGPGSTIPLSFENQNLKDFFQNVGKAIYGILEPGSEFGPKIIESMAAANEFYSALIADYSK